MDRFIRTKRLLGEEAFNKIRSSSVVVVGLGAVGGYAVEGLARGGMGKLRLVDFDTIQLSNINRQILALETTLDRPKCEVAVERVLAINPACQVEGVQSFVDADSLPALFSPRPDIVIDAIDALNPKIQLLSYAYHANIPIFSSMGAALRTDPGKVSFADISRSQGCPLAKRVRKRLRRVGIERGIGCVYSSEPIDFEYAGPDEEEQQWRGRARNVLGSMPTVTAIFGLTLANEVLLHLAGQGKARLG